MSTPAEAVMSIRQTLSLWWRMITRPNGETFDHTLEYVSGGTSLYIWKRMNLWILVGMLIPLVVVLPTLKLSSEINHLLFLALYLLYILASAFGLNIYTFVLISFSRWLGYNSNFVRVFTLFASVTASIAFFFGMIGNIFYWMIEIFNLQSGSTSLIQNILYYTSIAFGYFIHLLTIRHNYNISLLRSFGRSVIAALLSSVGVLVILILISLIFAIIL